MRIARNVVGTALLLVCLVGLPFGHAAPQGDWALEAHVPASTLGFVTLESVGTWVERVNQTALGKLMNHPEMKAFLAPLEKLKAQALEDTSPRGPIPPPVRQILKQLEGLHGQVAIALVDVDMERKFPDLVASLDFGNNVADFGTFLERMRTEMDPEGKRLTTIERNGRRWWQLNAPDGPPVHATLHGTAFVLGTSPATLDAVLTGVPEGTATLATTPAFQKVRTQAGGDRLAMFVYMNAPPVVDLMKQGPLGARELHMANVMGLDTVHAGAYALAFSGDGFRESFIVHAPNADHGLLSLMRYESYEPKFLPHVPSSAFYYGEGKATLDSLLTNVRKLAGAVDQRAADEMEQGLGWLGDQIGVDIEGEFLAGLTGQVAAYMSLPKTGGLYPEFAYLLGAKDPAAFEGIMERVANGLAGVATAEAGIVASTRTMDYHGVKMHLFDMQGTSRRDVIPFTPTWARIGDAFAITLVPHTMKELILRREVTESGLAGEEDFQAIRRAMPEGAGTLSYIDTQSLMMLAYDTLVPVLQTAAKPNAMPPQLRELDWALLPAARTVRPYMRSIGMYETWNDDGLAFATQGPVPVLGVMIVAGVGAWFAMSRMQRMEVTRSKEAGAAPMRGMERVQRDVAESQANALRTHVQNFVLVHDRLPTSLNELVELDVLKSLQPDPWGNSFKIVVTDVETKKYQLVSAGADRRLGSDDDIVVDG